MINLSPHSSWMVVCPCLRLRRSLRHHWRGRMADLHLRRGGVLRDCPLRHLRRSYWRHQGYDRG